VILAAGFGSRLQESGRDDKLKPLTLVGGVPLLVRATQSLKTAGCERVVIVLGFGADHVEAGFRDYPAELPEVVFTVNPRFDLKNGVSVLAARPHLLGDEFILMMADHVVDDDVMRLAGSHPLHAGTAALLVDAKLDTIFDMDDATKVVVDAERRITKIGKELASFTHVDCGVFVCTTGLMDSLDDVYRANGDTSLSDGVQALARSGRMYAVDIGAGFWQDIDTPAMLEYAERVLASRASR
jgi:choline kinase